MARLVKQLKIIPRPAPSIEESAIKNPAIARRGWLQVRLTFWVRASVDSAATILYNLAIFILLPHASKLMADKDGDPAKFAVANSLGTVSSWQTNRGVEMSAIGVRKLLERYNGGFELKSQPGQGAVFMTWRPVATQLKEAV